MASPNRTANHAVNVTGSPIHVPDIAVIQPGADGAVWLTDAAAALPAVQELVAADALQLEKGKPESAVAVIDAPPAPEPVDAAAADEPNTTTEVE